MVGTVAPPLAATGAPAAGAAPTDPGRTVRIELGFPSFTGVRDVQVTPHGTRRLFLADADTNDMFELHSAPIAGGTPTKLSDEKMRRHDSSHPGWPILRGWPTVGLAHPRGPPVNANAEARPHQVNMAASSLDCSRAS
jgi:hypothetical protein